MSRHSTAFQAPNRIFNVLPFKKIFFCYHLVFVFPEFIANVIFFPAGSGGMTVFRVWHTERDTL